MRAVLLLAPLLLAACVSPAAEPAPRAPAAAPAAAAADDPVAFCIGCGTTEAEYRASQPDAVLYPGVSPAAAAFLRGLETGPQARYGELLLAGLADFDCSFAVTDETVTQLELWLGRHAARAAGLPDADVARLAADLGYSILIVGEGEVGDDSGLVYGEDQELRGVAACLG